MKLYPAKFLTSVVAACMFCVLSAAVLADNNPPQTAPPANTGSTSQKTNKPSVPDVKLPFTFKCAHCGMPITIKTEADWNKDCGMCACGEKNIQCYKEGLKKSK